MHLKSPPISNGTNTNGTKHQDVKPKAKAISSVSYPSQSLQFLQKIRDPCVETHDEFTPSNPPQAKLKLKIIIVGAGLGGLATSIALARRGHQVTVLEQAHQLGEVGAGIQIPSNSSLLLERWGLSNFLSGKVVEPQGMTFRRWENGNAIGYTKLVPDFRESFGASYYVVHRADFHEALHQRALQLGVDVKVNCKVVDYDLKAPAVTLANADSLSADLVIAADGVKSVARRLVLGGIDHKPVHTGFAAYRATSTIGENRHVMTYTVAAGSSFNMVLSHVDKTDPSTWKQESALDDMKQEFSGWDPQLTKIIHLIDKCLKWPLMNCTPLKTWIAPHSKVLILGDAAHAMVPYMSQGAAMAVEDGAALATVLSLIDSPTSIPFALGILEKERLKRSSQMQEASMTNGILWHFPDGPLQEARDEAMRPEVEGKHFLVSANQWSDPVTQWWAYGYDAEATMQVAWDAAVTELINKAGK
ncbi:FAD-dependent monooxygenase [Lachnellula willkommii]|uniref:FAD-dependent monooxygenase n=1 Tax=Lachnellula willkommii TaxID=215461 RepID=A0A559MF18_9HELO|nr:FAD-dependent monooxygenase [Lachnellula willkommii]